MSYSFRIEGSFDSPQSIYEIIKKTSDENGTTENAKTQDTHLELLGNFDTHVNAIYDFVTQFDGVPVETFYANLSGHCNPRRTKTPGWSDDFISTHIGILKYKETSE